MLRFKLVIEFIIFTFLLFAVAGCGSSSSTTNNGTGSITAKLVWSQSSDSSQAKITEKVLYAAPAGVASIKFIVYYDNETYSIEKTFTVTAGQDGTGQIDGIPAGTGRRVEAIGKSAAGINIYIGTTPSNITINPGVATDIGVIAMARIPTTTASPPGGTYTSPQSVTLTANVPATIYYTTNGDIPTTSSTNGRTPISGISVAVNSILRFFAIDDGTGTSEAVKTESYNSP